ncbi:MAG: hypothetical protein WBD56_02080 [Anaerolineales bacterium]
MKDKCFLILGGGGMIGFQVAHRIARRLEPEKVIIASLYQKEVREAISDLEKNYPDIEFVGFWGNVFVRREFNFGDRQQRVSRNQLLESPEYRASLFDDLFGDVEKAYQNSHLVQIILTHKPDVIVDSINTATAISYQDIYTATHIASRDLISLVKDLDQRDEIGFKDQLEDARGSFEILMISQYIPQLIRHVILLNKAIREAGTRLYLKVGTTGTGGMGLNIPYTHGEDKPSAKLMSKTAMAFAHTGLMFLMARTPADTYKDAPPIIKEIKPAAMVGWVNITKKTIQRHGKPLYLCNSQTESLDERLTLQVEESKWQRTGKLQIPVVDTGENGLFTKGEFETITSLRQMEFMTPEEIARVVELEIRGANTGKDVIAAVDGAIMGPTYRAGYLRGQALEELDRLEAETRIPSVALGELGPPELSKLLWEAYLLKIKFGTLTAVLERQEDEDINLKTGDKIQRQPGEISASLEEYLGGNAELKQIITSVGIPILLPDGKTLIRGPFIRIPEVAGQYDIPIGDGDIDRWANKGWVDLREQNMARWQKRFEVMQRGQLRMRAKGSADVVREAYLHEEIYIGEVVSWVFSNEMGGYRLM